ncbi:MAG: FHA domain-containing protein [Actinobacteria bacterium]|nr:MAG: FHA domain-containing protein [Actinomycetota bacterium]
MEDIHDDVPDHVDIEQDPTVLWEPDATAETREDSSGKLAGAFAWALTIEGGPQTGLTYVLGSGMTVAGRGSESAIFLPDVTVSREHVRFVVDDAGLAMSDLGSTNGTYVNSQRLAAGMLREGDELMIGKYHLRVSRGHG